MRSLRRSAAEAAATVEETGRSVSGSASTALTAVLVAVIAVLAVAVVALIRSS